MNPPRDELFTTNERERRQARRRDSILLVVGISLLALGFAGLGFLLYLVIFL